MASQQTYSVILRSNGRGEPRLRVVGGFATEKEAQDWARLTAPQGGSRGLRDSASLIDGGDVLAVAILTFTEENKARGIDNWDELYREDLEQQAESARLQEEAREAKVAKQREAERKAAIDAKALELEAAAVAARKADFLKQAEVEIDKVTG
ncbi:hypothetical protein [Jiangella endophytica]|uniref:hypothetical protein n=1 Tax=Jiangella endophytica TaxID=1623398 RepID=UPI000E343A9A|nr:hypothetical protein [Jiangella endophytica]